MSRVRNTPTSRALQSKDTQMLSPRQVLSTRTPTLPWSLEDQRLQLLKMAGAKPEDVQKLWKTLIDALEAERVHVATHEGVITDERAYVDWTARLRAVEQLSGIFGLEAPRAPQTAAQVTVEVLVAPWAQQAATPARVIDAPPVESGT